MNIDFKEILEYAELSSVVYASDNVILAIHPNAIIREVVDLGLKVFILPDHINKVYWISCRGTANTENIWVDLQYTKSTQNLLDVPLHEGFYKSALAIYDKILRELPNNTYQIRLTGHSLGGAIAVILMMLLSKTRIIDKCITFGQPKVTTKIGAIKYKQLPLLRVIEDEDPVPLIPPLTLWTAVNHGMYRHFGKALILAEDDSYEYLDEPQAESIWRSSFWLKLGREDTKEHRMLDYTDNIKLKIAIP